MNLELLMQKYKTELASCANSLNAVPNPMYQKSVILDRLIWQQEKLLKGDEKLPFSREQAYLAAQIPQYFLR